MKKLLAISAGMALCISAYSQGQVNFVTAGTGIRYPAMCSNAALGLTWLAGSPIPAAEAGLPAGTPMRAALYIGPADSFESLTLSTATLAGSNNYAGFNASGLILTSTGGGVRQDGPAGAVFAQIRAWSGNYATYEEATAAYLTGVYGYTGLSPIIPVNLTVPPATPNNMTGFGNNTGMLFLVPVPEPGIIALTGLGLLGLLCIRRRK